MSTDRRFTGQRWDGALGLYDYRARTYDPALGRFISANPLVPEPGNPQALNRYAYVYNNPLRYTDPTGHYILLEDDFGVRITQEDVVQVVHGGSHFANPVEVALANAILSGETRHLERIPSDTPGWAMQRSLARVAAELGCGGSGIAVGDLLLDPLLVAGLGMAVGKGVENTVGAVSASWLDLVPAKYRASVAQAFEGTPEVVTLSEDLIVYRHWGGEAPETGSPWFSPKSYVRPGNARRYLALPNYNSANRISVFKIPAGTTIIRGRVASQVEQPKFGPYATGGGIQIYLPNPEDAILIGPLDVLKSRRQTLREFTPEKKIKDLLAQAREASQGSHPHWLLPHVIEVLETMLIRVHDPESLFRAAGALGRIVTDDYAFSESSLGGNLLDLVTEIVSHYDPRFRELDSRDNKPM